MGSEGDQTAAILDAARRVLEQHGMVAAATGELHRFGILVDSVDHPVAPIERLDVDVRSAQVLHADARVATVVLDATVHGRAQVVTGRPTVWKTKVSGPVQLACVDGEWKVTDLVIDGRSVLARFVERDRTDEGGVVRARLLAARLDPSNARLYLELENTSAEPVELRRAAASIRRRTFGWGWHQAVLGTRELAPGVSRVEVGTGGMKKLQPGGDIRLLFEAGGERLDLRPAGIARRRWTPLQARSPVLAWLVTAVTIALIVGVLTHLVFAPVAGVFEAGFVLVLLASSMLWTIARQSRWRFTGPFRKWLAAGFGTLALGVVLVVSDIGISSLGGIQSCFRYLFLNWWGLGLLLVYAALVLVLDHRPRRAGRVAVLWLCAVLAAGALGTVLVVRHGGFELLWPGTREKQNVEAFVSEAVGGADVVSLKKAASRRVDDCFFTVWDARTEIGRFWVVTNDFQFVSRGEARTAERALAVHLASQRRAQVVIAKAIGEPVPTHPSACPGSFD